MRLIGSNRQPEPVDDDDVEADHEADFIWRKDKRWVDRKRSDNMLDSCLEYIMLNIVQIVQKFRYIVFMHYYNYAASMQGIFSKIHDCDYSWSSKLIDALPSAD